MPIVDQETIQSLTQDLRGDSYQAKFDRLRSTAFNPPDDLSALPTIVGGAGLNWAQWNDPAHANFGISKMTDVGEMVSYLRLCPSIKSPDKYGSVTFQSTFAKNRTAQDLANGFAIPAWFLPWRQAGALVKLKISDVNNNGGQLTINNVNHPNPGLFFTAALSGCSVIVVGDPRNPSVYHGGSGNPVGGELQGHEKTEAFWLRKAGRHGEIANKPLGSIGKTDYISELIGGARTDADRMDKQTTLSIQLKQNLVASGALAEVSLLPWGYVFGLRKDDGTWVFYLVKCVSLSYYKWRVKKRMFGRDKRVHEGEMRLSGLSPTTGGNLAIDPSTGGVAYKTVRIAAQGVGQTVYDPIGAGDYSEQQISDCKVIGYEKFFPGRGKVHVRNIPMTQLY